MPAKSFFVLYDYGQGGLWAVIRAQSPEQVQRRYPELEVFEHPPAELSTEVLARIRDQGEIGVDDPPVGWLADLVAHRAPAPER